MRSLIVYYRLFLFAIGSEFVNEDWIKNQFVCLNEIFRKQMLDYSGSVQMYLHEKAQDLKAAQRIYFHLVDNEENHNFPFTFLVTYATKDEQGRILHMPLKHALVEYQKDHNQLVALLSCLNEVAQKNSLIAQTMQAGDIFYPIQLTSKEAYSLLQSVPDIEV